MGSDDFVRRALVAFGQFVQPLVDSVKSASDFTTFLADLGWTLDPSANIAQIQPAFQGVTAAATTLTSDATAGRDSTTIGQDIVLVVEALVALAATSPTALPPPLDKNAFWQALPGDLLELLVYRYLKDHHLLLFGALAFIGVLYEKGVDPNTTTGRNGYQRKSLDWGRLASALTKPDHMFADVYGWGGVFDHVAFMRNLGALLEGFRLSAELLPAETGLADMYFDRGNPARDDLSQLVITPFQLSADSGIVSGFIKPFLVALPIPVESDPTSAPVGIMVFPAITGEAEATIPLTPGVDMSIEGDFLVNLVRVEIRPTGTKLALFAAPISVTAKVQLRAGKTSGWTVLGDPASTGLRLYQSHAGLKATGPLGDFEYLVDCGIDHAEVVLDFSESDGFLKTVLGSDPQVLGFGLGVVWSSRTGFAFQGQAMLEANLGVHLTIAGILSIDSIYLALKADLQTNVLKAEAAVSGGLELGPVAAEVDRVGMAVRLKPRSSSQPGNLGTANFEFGFRPPNGIGLLIDAGPVVGGGYIFCDPDKGEYAGVLELAAEVVQIKVIGILNTILPGGQTGFSLLLIVTAEFEPIQLSFGFTLNGVGGLAGINRTMVLDALRTGLKNRTLNAILFPVDPVQHAKQIISDLQAVFPPRQNRYVFGPMVELGWGTPSLLIAELGIVLELPAPIRLAILGRIIAVLPDEDAAVVIIHLDVLGTIEFEKKFLSIDAVLYDSRVAAFTLLGEMALRLLWGENASFALSVGGLHPKFQPPPNFPILKRLTLSLGEGENPRLSCDTYFAVTSNSVQFGAGVSLYASAAGFSVEGYLGFDALFILSPFHFTVELQGSVDLKQGSKSLMSVSLDMMLDGPTPWHAAGTATAHILFFSVSVGFDHTFGDANQVSLPGEDPTAKLLAALNDTRSWHASLPADAERAVSLVAPNPDDKAVVVHPLGSLGVTQKVLPLGLVMSRFGSAVPSGVDTFEIGDVTLNGKVVPSTKYTLIDDRFAPGQFLDLSDDAKLSRPSFEPHTSGIQLTADGITTGGVQTLDLEYETILIDDPAIPGKAVGLYQLAGSVLLAQAGQGAAELSPLRNTGKRKFLDPGAPDGSVLVGDVTYTVTTTDDLAIRGDISESGSYSTVHQKLDEHLAEHPADRAGLQIRPVHEVAA